VETVSARPTAARAASSASEIAKSDRPELTAAKIIVSGGRALGSSEKVSSEVLTPPRGPSRGAALGGQPCRGGCGLRAERLQVGPDRKIVRPQLYIACGISGAIQHLPA
jgi:electron transfer flavoprotein alpha subunit